MIWLKTTKKCSKHLTFHIMTHSMHKYSNLSIPYSTQIQVGFLHLLLLVALLFLFEVLPLRLVVWFDNKRLFTFYKRFHEISKYCGLNVVLDHFQEHVFWILKMTIIILYFSYNFITVNWLIANLVDCQEKDPSHIWKTRRNGLIHSMNRWR